MKTSQPKETGNPAVRLDAARQKKDSGSARQGETTNTRKRAAARIAL